MAAQPLGAALASGSASHGEENVSGHADAGDGHGNAGEEGTQTDHDHAARRLSYDPLPTEGIQPWMLVRDLQLLQDMLVGGEASALEQYRQEILIVGARMKRADRSVWNIQRNLDAAATFLLIGGDPLVAEIALKTTTLTDSDVLPLKVAKAYADKDVKTAIKYFSSFSAADYPPSMRGQFAFAASVVMANIDAAKAENLLNASRRLSAGTLIEETALRRLVQIAGLKKDARQLSHLVRNYNERFPDSPYFGDFVRAFYQSSLLVTEEDFPLIEPLLREVVARLSPDKRLNVVSLIAEKAIGFGRLPLALWAADTGLELVKPDSGVEHQLSLYRAAALLPNRETMNDAKVLLGRISREWLDRDHARLFDAVTELAGRLDFDFENSELAQPRVRMVLPQDAADRQAENEEMKTAMASEIAAESQPILMRRDALFKQLDDLETVELK
ncbi:MAG: hypothetical protein KDJ69_07195 [Nitratireductor sp.]|nr:hypothetical protein [Nitratireductor sp.]